jgi:hypothetical protein
MAAGKAAQVVLAKTAENKATPYIVLGAVVVAGGLLTFVTIKVLEALQLKDTREEKRDARRAAKLYAEKAFDPAWAYNHPSKVTISTQEASVLAHTIYQASGWKQADEDVGSDLGFLVGWMYDDDEDAARGAVRQARTSYNLSKVADVFFKKYKVGLLDHLEDFNGEDEMEKYYRIVENFKS